jgi:transcriptional regulator with XRE-family HTH domain
MAAKDKRDSGELIRQLEAERDQRQINQEGLAELLGISQGHLSKIISGKVQVGRRTAARIRELAGLWPKGRQEPDGWLSAVSEAARRSTPFRAVVDAALKMVAVQLPERKGFIRPSAQKSRRRSRPVVSG